ncbi:MAG: hypothetical protein A3I11_06305 [Elusimicrobia bacterium RIFCSPLOWO2_02_FULL_39_32]|nr:MAG: hypothetical protein A2034_06970 [Elusimicrobia bacterium GWA2_38_7]OGR81179.1 MAG: hypothetical protein A3B80_08915 [Elusimicrobia bacterium RIFCSPHIGHO2_02_FULL_39_36]OGR91732.1 MAG: hypothetical protein A3I11_06305 [Elusimicrobia bacterium RIFCSPLOWO2_02_FULL_39_32]OGR98390.1 MAG: hypothetical protein A3G85_02160 [Elusimicrobia bacterium RIFCSPLOWO2_12_FULL_39_28]
MKVFFDFRNNIFLKKSEEKIMREIKARKCFFNLAILLSLISFGFLSALSAQIPKPKMDGFIDTTYNYDFNRPLSGRSNYRFFDQRTNNFLLNAVQINVDGAGQEGIGYHGEFAFGTDPSAYKAAGTNSLAESPNSAGGPSNVAYNFEIQEAFLTYNWNTYPIGVKLGKFASLGGLEVIESMNNFTISRGYLFFGAKPYTHVGAILGYTTPFNIDFWIGLVNGWDLHVDNNTDKTLVMKVGINLSENLNGSLSFYRGAEQNADNSNKRTTIDTTWFLKPLANTSLGLQLLYGQENGVSRIDSNSDGFMDTPLGTAKWYGFNLQGKYDFTEKISLGSRFEIFQDLGGGRILAPYVNAGIFPAGTFRGDVLHNFTLTPAYKFSDALLLRTEFRYDWAIEELFEGTSGLSNGGLPTERKMATVSLEVVYKF